MSFIFLFLIPLLSFAENRPEVFVSSDYCVCQDGRAVSYGNCSAFCHEKVTNGVEILFANFKMEKNPYFKNVRQWCNKVLEDETVNPQCAISLRDENGHDSVVDVVFTDKNSIKADVSNIPYDRTFVFRLTEKSSGANSSAAQLVKFEGINPHLPLKIASTSEFACVSRREMKKYHFYFKKTLPPLARTPESDFICHDVLQWGEIDDETFPRLNQREGIFHLWDGTQPLFYDNNGNGILDIDELIAKKVERYGGNLPARSKFFQRMTYPGSGILYHEAGASKFPGSFYMPYWVDSSTFKSYCPGYSHYQSSNPIFRALKDILGLETEGLYAGLRVSDRRDITLLREKDIKAVWFYMKDGVPTEPTDGNISNVSVFFYFPLDKVSPYVKKPGQSLYQVKGNRELGEYTGNTYPAHDRKLGCIPTF